jgi:hypothetical protein
MGDEVLQAGATSDPFLKSADRGTDTNAVANAHCSGNMRDVPSCPPGGPTLSVLCRVLYLSRHPAVHVSDSDTCSGSCSRRT